jgi:hypothetical protein
MFSAMKLGILVKFKKRDNSPANMECGEVDEVYGYGEAISSLIFLVFVCEFFCQAILAKWHNTSQ